MKILSLLVILLVLMISGCASVSAQQNIHLPSVSSSDLQWIKNPMRVIKLTEFNTDEEQSFFFCFNKQKDSVSQEIRLSSCSFIIGNSRAFKDFSSKHNFDNKKITNIILNDDAYLKVNSGVLYKLINDESFNSNILKPCFSVEEVKNGVFGCLNIKRMNAYMWAGYYVTTEFSNDYFDVK